MIKMQVIGNLGKDATVNNVSGASVINFTLAHTEKYRDSKGEQHEKTTWVDCAWWTDRVKIAEYLTKGKQIYVEGQPEVRTYTRQDSTAGANLSLRIRDVQLLAGGTPQAVTPTGNAAAAANNATDQVIDELPF